MTIQATMKNPDNALLPGMFVNAAVVLPPQPDVMVLPETAVEYTLYGDSVYVIREDGKDAAGHSILKAVRTPVKTGERIGGKVEILQGIEPGERVIAAGQVKVQSGARITISESPEPQPPGALTRH
jgi:multidrug efflux system membrane fusion protein